MLRNIPGLFLLLGLLLSLAQALDHCASGSTEINGNWYCQAVQRIAYENVGATGTYNKVDGMSTDNGGYCSSTPFTYSGTLAPFDEDLSIHLRGPIELKQFAVYVPGQSVPTLSKREVLGESLPLPTVTSTTTSTIHVTPVVTVTVATIVTVSINNCGPEALSTLEQDPAQVPASTSSHSAVVSMIPSQSSPGNWGRIGYYNSDDKISNGFVFLNNLGGSQSGDWNRYGFCYNPRSSCF
jgi:hypothetical protein